MAKLVIQRKGKPSKTYLVEYRNVLIGRGKDAQLLLPDISVSRHHARLVRREQGYVLMDLGSQNGTTVNGQRITEHLLESNDEIQMGKFLLIFHATESSLATDNYNLTGRVEFLKKVSALTGDHAHSTTHLSKSELSDVRSAVRIRDLARVVSIEDPSAHWTPGEKGIRFGDQGIPAKGMGSANIVIAWDKLAHVLLKRSGLLVPVKVAGKSVKRHVLQDGDTFQVGKSTFRYELESL
jgi:pSer/pThr/pTyr-binding forkhead associated (FHA) protein